MPKIRFALFPGILFLLFFSIASHANSGRRLKANKPNPFVTVSLESGMCSGTISWMGKAFWVSTNAHCLISRELATQLISYGARYALSGLSVWQALARWQINPAEVAEQILLRQVLEKSKNITVKFPDVENEVHPEAVEFNPEYLRNIWDGNFEDNFSDLAFLKLSDNTARTVKSQIAFTRETWRVGDRVNLFGFGHPLPRFGTAANGDAVEADFDGDGVANADDRCPLSPHDAVDAAKISEEGCALKDARWDLGAGVLRMGANRVEAIKGQRVYLTATLTESALPIYEETTPGTGDSGSSLLLTREGKTLGIIAIFKRLSFVVHPPNGDKPATVEIVAVYQDVQAGENARFIERIEKL